MTTKTKTNIKIAATGCLAAFLGLVALGATTGTPGQGFERASADEQRGPGDCPAGQANAGMGPEMTYLPDGFCIDTTEVTRGQYHASE